MGELEKEKYELQKSHTKNIQDLLDDTNKRLEAMEDEYSAQSQTTVRPALFSSCLTAIL